MGNQKKNGGVTRASFCFECFTRKTTLFVSWFLFNRRLDTFLTVFCLSVVSRFNTERHLPHKRRSSDRDVPENEMNYFFMNLTTDGELMIALNFLDCETGWTFACAVDKAQVTFLLVLFPEALEFCGKKRVVLSCYLCFNHGGDSSKDGRNHP